MNTICSLHYKKSRSVEQLIETMSKEIYYLDPLTHRCMNKRIVDGDGAVHYIGLLRNLPYYWDKTDNINIEEFLHKELWPLSDDSKELYREKARKSLQIILNHPTLFNKIRREAKSINKQNDMSSFRAKTGI